MNTIIFAADVYIPGLFFPLLAELGPIGLVLFLAAIVLLESFVLVLVKWGNFAKALLVAFIMNLVSTILGVFVDSTLSDWTLWWGILAAFFLSVVIEGIVLMLIKPGALRLNWLAALAANLASYVILILPLVLILLSP